MAGGAHPVAVALQDKLLPGRQATARGRMFAVPDADGWFPALAHDPAGSIVHGMLHETAPRFAAHDLASLDAWEGADYARREIPVEEGGRTCMADAWLWRGAVPQGAIAIPGGDFRAFITGRGWAEYGGP